MKSASLLFTGSGSTVDCTGSFGSGTVDPGLFGSGMTYVWPLGILVPVTYWTLPSKVLPLPLKETSLFEWTVPVKCQF